MVTDSQIVDRQQQNIHRLRQETGEAWRARKAVKESFDTWQTNWDIHQKKKAEANRLYDLAKEDFADARSAADKGDKCESAKLLERGRDYRRQWEALRKEIEEESKKFTGRNPYTDKFHDLDEAYTKVKTVYEETIADKGKAERQKDDDFIRWVLETASIPPSLHWYNDNCEIDIRDGGKVNIYTKGGAGESKHGHSALQMYGHVESADLMPKDFAAEDMALRGVKGEKSLRLWALSVAGIPSRFVSNCQMQYKAGAVEIYFTNQGDGCIHYSLSLDGAIKYQRDKDGERGSRNFMNDATMSYSTLGDEPASIAQVYPLAVSAAYSNPADMQGLLAQQQPVYDSQQPTQWQQPAYQPWQPSQWHWGFQPSAAMIQVYNGYTCSYVANYATFIA